MNSYKIRKKLLNKTPFEQRQFAAMQAIVEQMNTFVTYPQAKKMPVVTVTTEQENEKMNTDAIYHLERDLTKAFYSAQSHLRDKHHLSNHQPKTVREYLTMIKDGKFDELTDKELDRTLKEYEHASEFIRLRYHPADENAHTADTEKLNEAYRAASLAVKTSTDHDKTREKVTEAFRKQWLH